MKHLFIIISAIFILYSCFKKDKVQYERNIAIRVDSAVVYQWSDFFLMDKIVPLETNKWSNVGNITGSVITNDTFYIADYSGKVTLFSKNGKYLSHIYNKGRGPGEYIRISMVDYFKNKILVFDNELKRLLYYQGNKFLKQNAFNFSMTSILMEDSAHFLAFDQAGAGSSKIQPGEQIYRLKQYNSGKIQQRCLPINSSFVGYVYSKGGVTSHFIINGAEQYLFDVFSDAIYKVDSNLHVKPWFHLDFGKHALNLDKAEVHHDEMMRELQTADPAKALLMNAFIRDDFMYFYFTLKGARTQGPSVFNDAVPYDVIYDRGSGVSYVSNRQKHSLFFGIEDITYMSFRGDYQGAVISIPAMSLVERYEQTPEALPPQLQKTAQHIRITDNPVLVFLKYKGTHPIHE